MTIENKLGSETVLSGELPDRTALLGFLKMIHALSLTIIFVKKGEVK